MFRLHQPAFTLLFLVGFCHLHSQTLDVTITDATCSSNGGIEAMVMGGSGDYSYQLSGSCLPMPVVQSSPVFNNLEPCEYTLTVTDGATGQTIEGVYTVGGTYQPPQLSLFCGSCQITADVTEGALPFVYAISTNGIGGPFTTNSPPGNPEFDNTMAGEFYWVQVVDGCGNITVEECQTGVDAIEGFSYSVVNGNLQVDNVDGGSPPFLFTLQSSAGTFSNQTGIFPEDEWGCNMTLTVSDGCNEVEKAIIIRPTYEIDCVNFADGIASLNIIYGIEPFMSITCSTPDSTYYSDDGNFAGLPINADYYEFQIIDACGLSSVVLTRQLKGLALNQTPVSCSETTLDIVADLGNCLDGVTDFPVEFTCASCPAMPTEIMGDENGEITFSGQNIGDWEIAIEDNCGDHFICEDTIELDIMSLCDSIQATLVQRFACDNSNSAERPIDNGNAPFVLLNAMGSVIGSSTSGTFHNITPGFYTVQIDAPGCGFYEDTITVVNSGMIDPVITYFPLNKVINGICRTTYVLHFELEQGPFVLTGGPDNIYVLVNDDNLVATCSKYFVADLLPGEYELTSLDNCGSTPIFLPEPIIELEAIGQGNCPGSGSIIALGAQPRNYWEDWSGMHEMDVLWSSFYWGTGFIDHYSLDTVTYGQFTQSGSPYLFTNIEPGFHTVYLYTFRSECPIDTVEVFVPETSTIDVQTTGAILCDGAFNTDVLFEITGGGLPYTIEELDCNDLTQVLGSNTFYDTLFTWSNLPEGDHCFRILDSCSISLDYQLAVQPYQDEVDVTFNCDNTITLSVDSLDVGYTWLDVNNNVIGNAHSLTVPNPGNTVNYTVLIDLGPCELSREVEVPATQIIPTVSITGDDILCEGNTNTLSLVTDAATYEWNTSETTFSIDIINGGQYAVTVTNDLGCTASDVIEIMGIPFLQPAIAGTPSFCENSTTTLWLTEDFQQIQWSTGSQADSIVLDAPGLVNVMVVDSFGCEWSNEINVIEHPTPLPIIEANGPLCFGINDGTIAVSDWAGGAVAIAATLNDALPVSAPTVFENLPPGSFDVLIEDEFGCTSDTIITFEEPPSYFVDLGNDTTIALGDQVQLQPVTNLFPVDSFQYAPTTYLFDESFTPWSFPLNDIVYQLQLWDEMGCLIEDQIQILVDKTPAIYAPNAFSPNDDGINDFFTLYAKSSAVTNIRKLLIFDRWGDNVFVTENIPPNNEGIGWDGMFRGKIMNPAVFAWRAEVEFIDGSVSEFYGDVTLVR